MNKGIQGSDGKLRLLVGLSDAELRFLLELLKAFERGIETPLPEMVGDIRESIALARHGKILKSRMAAIRRGARK